MPETVLTLHSRQQAPEVYQTLRGIPGALSGKEGDPEHIRHLFLSHFLHHLLTSIHTAYLAKSRGQSDSLGFSWSPLSPATIARKLAKRQHSTPTPHNSFLTKTQQKAWSTHYSAAFNQLRSTIPTKDLVGAARQAAWHRMRHSRNTQVPINIDTGRLLASLSPGTLAGDTYVPASYDQYVDITPAGLQFASFVPYSSHVHKKRRLFPTMSQMRPWTKAAAAAAVIPVLRRIFSD